MKLLRTLSVLLPTAILLPLAGCQESPQSLVGQEAGVAGGLSFQLDTAVLSKVRSTADSLRLELRKGATLRTVAAKLDQAVRVTDLEPGEWTLDAGLYSAAGSLSWYAKGTVLVTPGGTAKVVLDLKPAKGSVDVSIRLDTTVTTRDSALVGMWYFRVAGNKLVEPGRTDVFLYLGADGSLKRSDGCNASAGTWLAKDSLLTMTTTAKPGTKDCDYLPTYAYATDYEIGNVLDFGIFWKITGSNVLRLSDKNGKELGVLTRSPAPVLPSNCQMVSEDQVKCNDLPPIDSDSAIDSAVVRKLGGAWLLSRVNGKPSGRVLSLDGAGAFSVQTACNGISGRWWASETSLSMASMAMTKMFCVKDSADTSATEGEIAQALAKVVYWIADEGGVIRLYSSNRTELAVLHRMLDEPVTPVSPAVPEVPVAPAPLD